MLPVPDVAAAAISGRLADLIRAEIGEQQGFIPFSRYMELALYAPGLGYYTAGSHKLGEGGDFVTAPELTPLFARTLARQLAQLLPLTGGTVYEFGAGSGILAADLLDALRQLDVLPVRYRIMELSPDLRARQQALLAARHPDLLERIDWLEQWPEQFDGVVLGNEVLDAMPCELVTRTAEGELMQTGVGCAGPDWQWQQRPVTEPVLAQAAAGRLPARGPYTSEIGLAAEAFVATLGRHLQRGAVILLDYGFPAHEFYHPQRAQGTLMCHYQHLAHTDPFQWPGLTDITCHVDFSAIAEAGLNAGLELAGYTTQANFLLNCGLTDCLAELDPDDVRTYLPQAHAVQKLVSPAEMGELFKVIGFAKGIDAGWTGFARGDRSGTL